MGWCIQPVDKKIEVSLVTKNNDSNNDYNVKYVPPEKLTSSNRTDIKLSSK